MGNYRANLVDVTETVGLREQKKSQTRLAISRAAHTLEKSRPYAEITIAQIAAEAGVSRRTFSNYYASKADAFAGLVEHQLIDIATELLAAPEAGVRQRLASAFKSVDQAYWDDSAAIHRLSHAEPEIAAVAAFAEKRQCDDLVRELVRASGGELDEVRLSVTVAAIGACICVCIDRWFDDGCIGGTTTLADMVAGSLDILDLSWLDSHIGLLRTFLTTPD